MKTFEPSTIEQSARELAQRIGSAAIDYVLRRIAMFQRGGDLREADTAWRLLTAVEKLLASRSADRSNHQFRSRI